MYTMGSTELVKPIAGNRSKINYYYFTPAGNYDYMYIHKSTSVA